MLFASVLGGSLCLRYCLGPFCILRSLAFLSLRGELGSDALEMIRGVAFPNTLINPSTPAENIASKITTGCSFLLPIARDAVRLQSQINSLRASVSSMTPLCEPPIESVGRL